METYVTLVTGIGSRERSEASLAAVEAAGCKIVSSYTLMGRFDALLVLEAPDAISAGVAIWNAKKAAGDGVLQTETLRAFTPAEQQEWLKRNS
jgi:uncharacterized protein with GYD domain